jgi:hypothetical protein
MPVKIFAELCHSRCNNNKTVKRPPKTLAEREAEWKKSQKLKEEG